MRHFLTAIIIAFSSLSSLASEEATLGDFLTNYLHTHDLAVACAGGQEATTHIPVYISKLKPKSNPPALTRQLRYGLARHFLDCHHLCQAFYHQTYILDYDLKVFDLMEEAFPGFKKATKAEGGIWISGIYDFLQTRDLFTGKPKRAQQDAAGQSATAE